VFYWIYDLPSWTGFREHPEWDEYWQAKALQTLLTEPTVPALTVGGYWDQEDLLGPWALYGGMEANDTDDESSIVMGPWYHGEWNSGSGEALGPIEVGKRIRERYARIARGAAKHRVGTG